MVVFATYPDISPFRIFPFVIHGILVGSAGIRGIVPFASLMTAEHHSCARTWHKFHAERIRRGGAPGRILRRDRLGNRPRKWAKESRLCECARHGICASSG